MATSPLGYAGMPRRRGRKRPSPVPFIVGGTTLLMLVLALVFWANQGSVVEVRGPDGKPVDDAKLSGDPALSAGPKPSVSLIDGSVGIVKAYLNDHLHDPEVQFVKWGELELFTNPDSGLQAWNVTLRFRGKNQFGAWRLSEWTFVIRNGEVVDVQGDETN